ncbi:MAG: hypothetical protein ACOYJK_04795 [Prevotella sp.]|jgi:(p)ppGpp synthase/HD superfamily hydrolase
MKVGNEIIPLEIICKRSTNIDPITQDTVEKCIRIAMDAHEGQRDRDGNAVILHPLLVGSMGKTDAEKCVGFLHDVVEDTDRSFDDLRNEDIPEEIIDALKLCTHNEKTDYYDYVQRIIDSGNMTAIHVKLNDLHHNIARGKAFGHPDLVAKHEKVLHMIEDFLKKQKNL